MRSLFRSRVPAGHTTGGQFAARTRPEPTVALVSRASTAAACLRQLADREEWRPVMPLPSTETPPGGAVSPGAGVVLQLHRSTVTPEAVLVQLDPDRTDPWAHAAYFELRGEELSRVASRPDGSRYRTFIASGVTCAGVLAERLDTYLRRD